MSRKQSSNRTDNLTHNLALGIFVELQDLDLLVTHRFYNTGGYAMTKINGKTASLHRLVHSRMTGKPLSEYTHKDAVRHIDPNCFDCRRSNLFVKTGVVANNCDLNRKLHCANGSGIHGVSWFKPAKQWKVQLAYLGTTIYLGYYDTLEQAARVACQCRITRSEITCSDTPMDFETMKDLLQAEAKTV